ncbi:MAG: zinc ribbon domain-containing protein, partial [Lactobacillus sp.]|nr:zinc ribbon domain-containing protein [Lactobacillus sp.]
MTTCPNCGRPITDVDVTCPNCHFDLQKYRETFFTDQHEEAHFEDEKTAKKIASRKVYRQEFYPEKQNSVIERMLQWIHVNSMIVFLLGIALLIIMSFSRSFGWICFFALLVWLYFVCSRAEKIERYTV